MNPRRTALIGPNAILQTVAALDAALGRSEARALLARAGFSGARLAPRAMTPESEAAALHAALRRTLGVPNARRVGFDAGLRTAAYVAAHRIPKAAARLLTAAPPRLAAALLLRAMAASAWTFAGSGRFRAALGPLAARDLVWASPARPRARLFIENCPLCRAGPPDGVDHPLFCDYYSGAFQGLFRRFVSTAAAARQVPQADDAPGCAFEVRW